MNFDFIKGEKLCDERKNYNNRNGTKTVKIWDIEYALKNRKGILCIYPKHRMREVIKEFKRFDDFGVWIC